jgi:hypothetical protein
VSYAPYAPPAEVRDARPAVIRWFRVYAAVMATACMAALGLAIWSAVRADGGPRLVPILSCVVAATFAALYGVATFVPFKPWGWTLGLVAIGLGLGGCTIVFAAPLLVLWLRLPTKAAFARL